MILAALAGFAGALFSSRSTASLPMQGAGLLFDGIAAAVIGGTSIFGGSGTIVGAVLGALVIGTVYNGLTVLGAPAFLFEGFVGLLIVIATVINTVLRKRRV